METKSIVRTFLYTLLFFGFSSVLFAQVVIPKPQHIVFGNQFFLVQKNVGIYYSSPDAFQAALILQKKLKTYYGCELPVVNSRMPETGISMEAPDAAMPMSSREAYYIRSDAQTVIIQSGSSAGFGNAVQTLSQIFSKQGIPMVKVLDAPKFSWRGMHLDVSRHFFSVSFIKRYLDIMAMYKFNRFHWHLTDDQGWRIEIKSYPKLCQTGAWRSGSMKGPYSDQVFDTKTYGGFYTQSEIKEVIDYAAALNIMVVPEIEMPGHSTALLAAYPFLSCRQKPLEVAKAWGVFEDVLCTRDTCFQFLETVLDEVCRLFPGPYIHIGGDECPKTRWKSCEHCQKRMLQENLKNEMELQSYFIKRVESYLKTKNKSIIGWDEILEGGLAPEATVMSWRGERGGIEAAQQGHAVVMSPGQPCYFDHYQDDPVYEPLAIGGLNTLKQVYDYKPIPALLNSEFQGNILGAQGNVWTEYMETEQQVEYMVLPRLTALAEVLWASDNSYENYLQALALHFKIWDRLGYHYGKAILGSTLKTTPGPRCGTLRVQLESDTIIGRPVFKTTTGFAEGFKSLIVSADTVIEFGKIEHQKPLHTFKRCSLTLSKASSAHIQFNNQPDLPYNTGGSFTLVDGIRANKPRIPRQWLGWQGKDLEALVDLERNQSIASIEIGFLKEESAWIYLPANIEIWTSVDGQKYSALNDIPRVHEDVFKVSFSPLTARFIKIKAKNLGRVPAGKPGAGSPAWLFCDEIIIH